MMSPMISGKALALLFFLLSAFICSCMMKPAATVLDADNGSRVDIRSGEILAVKLAAQLGTGFGWKVVSENKNLSLKGSPEQIAKDGKKPGAPEFQVFQFKAGDPGETELKLHYLEAWKKESKPVKDFTITVVVK